MLIVLDLCNALDEFSEEDKNDEILVQQIYVLVRLGRLEEAEKLSSDVGVAEWVFFASW